MTMDLALTKRSPFQVVPFSPKKDGVLSRNRVDRPRPPWRRTPLHFEGFGHQLLPEKHVEAKGTLLHAAVIWPSH
jgi:hypothetical protein